MTRNQPELVEILDVLACDITARPRSAPTIDAISRSVLRISREEHALAVEFVSASREDVAAFVDAESQCCATMRWELSDGEPLVLRVGGTAEQLDMLAAVFALPPAE